MHVCCNAPLIYPFIFPQILSMPIFSSCLFAGQMLHLEQHAQTIWLNNPFTVLSLNQICEYKKTQLCSHPSISYLCSTIHTSLSLPQSPLIYFLFSVVPSLNNLPISFVWAWRKSLKQSKPFISGVDLICAQQVASFRHGNSRLFETVNPEGNGVKMILPKLLLWAQSFKIWKAVCTILLRLTFLAQISFPFSCSMMITIPENPSGCHLPITWCSRLE